MVVDAHGPPALEVGDPEGVDLPVLAALHDGDDPGWTAAHGDEFLERAIELGIYTFGRFGGGGGALLAEGRVLAGQVGNGEHRTGQSRLFEETPPADDPRASEQSL